MKLLHDIDLVEGVTLVPILGRQTPGVKLGNIGITLAGLEYLEVNPLMKKAAAISEGIT